MTARRVRAALSVASLVAVALLVGFARHHDGSGPVTASPATASPATASPSPATTSTTAPSPTPPIPAAAGGSASYVQAASWHSTTLGYQLQAHPSRYGRTHTAAAPGRALRQAIAAAGPAPLHLSETVRGGLTDQLRCHAAFAPHKPQWDLESWRPRVGYLRTVLAGCDP